MEHDAKFALLRMLLSQPDDSMDWTEAVQALLERVQAEDPEIFAQVWIPYCEAHQEQLGGLRLFSTSAESMAAQARYAPFATIALSFGGAHADVAAQCAASPHLGMVRSLSFHEADLNQDGFQALLHAPQLRPEVLQVKSCRLDESYVDGLIHAPVFGGVRYLSLVENDWVREALRRFPYVATLEQLRGLRVEGSYLVDEIQTIAKAPTMQQLEALYLNNTNMDGRTLELLTCGEYLPALHILHAMFNNIDGEGLEAFAQSPHFGRFRELGLGYLECEVLPVLLASPFLDHIRELNVFNYALTVISGYDFLVPSNRPEGQLQLYTENHMDDGAVLVGQTPALEGLRSLRMPSQDITAYGVEALVQSPHLRDLALLDLRGNILDDEALSLLTGEQAFPHLKELYVNNMGFISEDIECLAKSTSMGALQTLSLSYCKLDDDALAALAAASHLDSLEALHLDGNRFGVDGLQALLSAPFMPSLKVLSFSGELDDEAAQMLADAPGIQSLHTLRLLSSKMTDVGRKVLEESPYLARERMILRHDWRMSLVESAYSSEQV